MLRQAARKCRKYGNVSFHRADITNIRCRDGRFDKVVAGNVIHLLPDSGKALADGHFLMKWDIGRWSIMSWTEGCPVP